MDPIKIIQKFYKTDSLAYSFLVPHSQSVAKKAIEIAIRVPHLSPDLKFIEEASMLHDIGIFLVSYQKIGCFGDEPYICHGYLGRELVEKEGYPKHALVCERHIGLGISMKDIKMQKLPLPCREMMPISIEEKIICLADKFFSKNKEFLTKEKSIDQIRKDHLGFGEDKIQRLDEWLSEFKI
ncbi:phosphohydrolase [Candidatus Falkowbacteria bacterium HGW-Falkowbacteria-1]|jgi:uncharacterized protein|uniref:Phosphohydrolase n=1 Tax=Candidatus Falkowbacteria bacterium HGW-Falkowbacteria-1 TaxID=2013768 RepID=A0A2N2EAH6_9BACT|nr:MAG: phosphohydrolase [Candidatus Falkowbacteria bacterium HGW-Falkowbacteria-1]